MRKEAKISECGKYRYRLDRSWAAVVKKACLFIMLNPSTADADVDDPTIRRCIRYVKDWGYNHLVVVNLFALRATNPSKLKAARDPVGPDNLRWIESAVWFVQRHGDGPVICAWGAHGDYLGQDKKVVDLVFTEMGEPPMCLGKTKTGQPKHPLYLRADLEPRYLFSGAKVEMLKGIPEPKERTLLDEVSV